MSSPTCPRCGAPVWGSAEQCNQCGNEIYPRGKRDDDPALSGGTLPMKKIAFFIVLAVFASVMAFRYWSNNSDTSLSSSTGAGKKSINTPGEAVDLTQHLASGKYTIAYFYADW